MQQPIQAESGSAAAMPTVETPHSEGVRRFSVTQFLITLILIILTVPLVDGLKAGVLIEAVLWTLMLLSAVLAVGGRRRSLIAASALAAPAVALKWIHHVWPDAVPQGLTIALVLVCMAFITVHLLRFVFRAPRVDTEVLSAGIALHLMLGISWTFAFRLISESRPASFVFSAGAEPAHAMTVFEALYFSLGTLTGFAYGDIVPVSKTARMLATVEAMTGMFYMTILIARLVGLYSPKSRSEG